MVDTFDKFYNDKTKDYIKQTLENPDNHTIVAKDINRIIGFIQLNEGHKTAYLWVFESNEKAIRFYERLGGIKKEQSMKNVFGYDVLSRKVEWDDLSKIYGTQ